MILNSETFHGERKSGLITFDSWKVNNKFFDDVQKQSKAKKNYNLMIKNTGHSSMSDASLVMESASKKNEAIPQNSDCVKTYRKFINIVLAFLDENEFLPVKFDKKVQEIVDQE
mmetsp:Transcript_24525/g.28207  ORF Transcript_24525/g.28207 Transcript_24525/m.28207 type:complete len:114 (-) Transcript_24525:25-366(-)|eukprot:CAMPEP_0168326368 /NCGR_PEP_ID=MMETSP0213-20121227/5254_1 /TAXON_ID=151035 /ORGANISM="Euplotes harpa, Strain FSP1.4" /LENGTH=113 /DNA_ID=CAMNT_0008329055 /DNA_START=1012 /DNA_END=1353 /DNA_ORIENTATION=-